MTPTPARFSLLCSPPTWRRLVAVAAVALALAAPAAAPGSRAASEDPASAQYDPTAKQVADLAKGEEQEAEGLDGRVVGALPFTGMDVLIMGLAAVAVTGTGIVLLRVSRPRTGDDEAGPR